MLPTPIPLTTADITNPPQYFFQAEAFESNKDIQYLQDIRQSNTYK